MSFIRRRNTEEIIKKSIINAEAGITESYKKRTRESGTDTSLAIRSEEETDLYNRMAEITRFDELFDKHGYISSDRLIIDSIEQLMYDEIIEKSFVVVAVAKNIIHSVNQTGQKEFPLQLSSGFYGNQREQIVELVYGALNYLGKGVIAVNKPSKFTEYTRLDLKWTNLHQGLPPLYGADERT